MSGCDCSEEYGPCEVHGEVLAQGGGAAFGTADEQLVAEMRALVDVGAELSVAGSEEFDRLVWELEQSRDPVSGTAWFSDPDDHGAADWLVCQLESTIDHHVYRDDGFTIVRLLPGCPLLEDDEPAEESFTAGRFESVHPDRIDPDVPWSLPSNRIMPARVVTCQSCGYGHAAGSSCPQCGEVR